MTLTSWPYTINMIYAHRNHCLGMGHRFYINVLDRFCLVTFTTASTNVGLQNRKHYYYTWNLVLEKTNTQNEKPFKAVEGERFLCEKKSCTPFVRTFGFVSGPITLQPYIMSEWDPGPASWRPSSCKSWYPSSRNSAKTGRCCKRRSMLRRPWVFKFANQQVSWAFKCLFERWFFFTRSESSSTFGSNTLGPIAQKIMYTVWYDQTNPSFI